MNEDEETQGGSQRPPWVAFGIVATIALGIVVAYVFVEREQSEQLNLRRERRAELLADRGTACRPLIRAAEKLDSGNEKAARVFILEAERMAIRALDRSGVAFGKPERLALFLAEDVRAQIRGERALKKGQRLDSALEWCEDFLAS